MINSLTKIHNLLGNPYIHYYLGQQDGHDMPVFRGSPWQRGYGQTGYGIGKIAKPMIKSGAKALGNIALTSGVNLLGAVLAGKSVKQAARTRALEGANAAKMQAIRVQRYAQTGRGRSRSSRRSARKRKASRTKRRAKKRKASASATRRKPTKRARTSPRDIFG